MVAVDTNVLVYAHRRETEEHAAARALLQSLAGSRGPWAIPWPCAYEFFSIATNVRLWRDAASTPDEAWRQLEAWFEAPNVRLLAEPEAFTHVLERMVRRSRVRGPVVHDARVAALCLAHGVETLYTRDRDFGLFPELRVENPFR
ncbi:MAG: type II toxin-antitoxin system VapC family toxin [Vicinamibacterales bacterium]